MVNEEGKGKARAHSGAETRAQRNGPSITASAVFI